MRQVNVIGTTNGVVLYNGNSITCYPGSNQTDTGKLQLEFNMSRFVTRVSSKNFCVTNPSFVVSSQQSTTLGIRQLVVSAGQASINGMDLIVLDSITVNPPEEIGTFYLALHLQRDDDAPVYLGTGNVKGDLVEGADVIFQGVNLSYYDEKPEKYPVDMLFLAKVVWNGSDFTSIEEDEDKYGRLWAEDVMAKINDPKHPDIHRMLLQDWINIVPDWYVSKEGDTEFGAIEWFPGRQDDTYISSDYGTGKYSIKIQAESDISSKIIIKPVGDNGEDYGPDRFSVVTGNRVGTDQHRDIITLGTARHIARIRESGFNYYAIENTEGNIILQGKNVAHFTDGDSGFYIIDDVTKLDSGNYTTKVYGKIDEYGIDFTKYGAYGLPYDIGGFRVKWSDSMKMVAEFGLAQIEVHDSTEISQQRLVFKSHLDRNHTDTPSISKIVFEPQIVVQNNITGTGNLNITGNGTFEGDVTANKVWNAVYNDGIEWMEKSNYDEDIQAGDVVYFTEEGTVTKYSSFINIRQLAGVVSSEETFGYALGGEGLEENQRVPVALFGRVYIKINQPTKVGDIIGINETGETCILKEKTRYALGVVTKNSNTNKAYIKIF